MADVKVYTPMDIERELGALTRTPGMVANRSRSERVIYYRKPNRGREAGWIMWADSQPGKRLDYMTRGFEPLPQFGRVGDWTGLDGDAFRLYGPWGPILCHPNGPAAFPVAQLITYRWYTEDGLRFSCGGQLPPCKFPQLEGVKITEYACPECGRTLLQAEFLARHLRIAHDYERHEVIALGEQMGVDFSKELVGGLLRHVEATTAGMNGQAEVAAPPGNVNLETVAPTSTRGAEPCGWCIQAVGGICRRHRGEPPKKRRAKKRVRTEVLA